MPRLYFETDTPEPCPFDFGGPDDVLVYFLSFAFATRYGAQHPYSQLVLHLRAAHKVDLRPLLTFADRAVEEEADRAELERAWQPAAPLAETLRRVIDVIESRDEKAAALVAGEPALGGGLRDLLRMAEWAAARGAKVRITYEV